MARNAPRTPLTWRPIVPGSDQHLALLSRTQRLGRTLYPSLYARRDHDVHRRACELMAIAPRTKRETPGAATPEASVPIPNPDSPGVEDGRSAECA